MIINIITANTTNNWKIQSFDFRHTWYRKTSFQRLRRLESCLTVTWKNIKKQKPHSFELYLKEAKNNWQGETCRTRLVSGLGWIIALRTSDSWVIMARLLCGIFCQQNRINSIMAALWTSLKYPGEEKRSPLHAQKLKCQKKASNFAVSDTREGRATRNC